MFEGTHDAPLNEGRSLNSGDTHNLTRARTLNEGRSLNSGDTASPIELRRD